MRTTSLCRCPCSKCRVLTRKHHRALSPPPLPATTIRSPACLCSIFLPPCVITTHSKPRLTPPSALHLIGACIIRSSGTGGSHWLLCPCRLSTHRQPPPSPFSSPPPFHHHPLSTQPTGRSPFPLFSKDGTFMSHDRGRRVGCVVGGVWVCLAVSPPSYGRRSTDLGPKP